MSESPETPESADIPDSPTIPEMSALWGKGERGPKGEKGDRGDKGNQGNQGFRGIRGDKGAIGESRLAQAAGKEVERLIKAKSMPRWWGKAFIALFILVGIVVGIGIWNVNRVNELVTDNRNFSTSIQHGAFTECISGNVHLGYEQQIVDAFVSFTPANGTATGKYFLQLAAHNFAQRDCYTLYNVTPPKGYVAPVTPPLPPPPPVGFDK
jgi:hypothetical protein